jgi:hypothetical protein
MRRVFQISSIIAVGVGVCFAVGQAIVAFKTRSIQWPPIAFTAAWFLLALVLRTLGLLALRVERMEKRLEDLIKKL